MPQSDVHASKRDDGGVVSVDEARAYDEVARDERSERDGVHRAAQGAAVPRATKADGKDIHRDRPVRGD